MKTWVKVILGLTVIGGIGYAAYRYVQRQQKLIEQYEIKPIYFQILNWTQGLITLAITLRFSNKSNIEATIQELSVDIYVQNVFVGKVTQIKNTLIPAKGQSDVQLQLTAAPKELLKNAVSIFTTALSKKDITYRINGNAKIKSSFIAINIPIDYTGSVKADLFSAPAIT